MTYRVETLLLSGHISTVLFDDQEQAEAQYKKIKDVIGIPSWKNDTAGEVTIDLIAYCLNVVGDAEPSKVSDQFDITIVVLTFGRPQYNCILKSHLAQHEDI